MRRAVHPRVAVNQIAPAQAVDQFDGGLPVVRVKDAVSVLPEGANNEDDDGGVLVGDDDVVPCATDPRSLSTESSNTWRP
jgi:hypothetical protein